MSVSIKSPDFSKLFRDRVKGYEKAFARAMEEAATDIVQRTQSGKDADGKKFVAYSPAYKKAKQYATGRGRYS